jgi:hypothetical protein
MIYSYRDYTKLDGLMAHAPDLGKRGHSAAMAA